MEALGVGLMPEAKGLRTLVRDQAKMVGREEDKRFLLALRLLGLKEPDAEWVVDPVRDRDMLTLQTCTYSKLDDRLIVRAECI